MGKQQLCNPKQAIVVARKLSQLATAPPPPPPVLPAALRTYTLCELVTQNRALLLQALQQGHRFKDLQALFGRLGISIAETTFYRYLREAKDEPVAHPDTAALPVSASTDPATQSAQLTELIAAAPSSQHTPEQIVTAAYEPIQRALTAGYTFTEIAKLFQKHHVAVSVRQLKQEYLQLEASRQAVDEPSAENDPLPLDKTATSSSAALALVSTVSAAALTVVSNSLTVKFAEFTAQTDAPTLAHILPATEAETVVQTAPLTIESPPAVTVSGTDQAKTVPSVEHKAKAKRTVSPHVSPETRKRHRAKRAETRAALARG